MTDAYCRVNRARGMDLISPEDLLNACNTFLVANIPMKIHTFESTGVSVIQMVRFFKLLSSFTRNDIPLFS